MITKSDLLSRHTRRKIAHDARRLSAAELVAVHGTRSLHVLDTASYNAALTQLHADGRRLNLKKMSKFKQVVDVLGDFFRRAA